MANFIARVTRILANPTRYEYESIHPQFGILRFESARWQPEILCPACKGLGRVFTIIHHQRECSRTDIKFMVCPVCRNLDRPVDLGMDGLVCQLSTHDDRPLVAIMEDFE